MGASPDLYGALGIDRNADAATIRKAYRRASKKAHPDGGGSAESFAIVTLAKESLSDEERRRKYDETGEVGEKPVDMTEAAALQLLFAEIDAVFATIERRGNDWSAYDIVADSIVGLKTKIREAELNLTLHEQKAREIKKAAARFSAKSDKPNRISPMFEARARDVAQNGEKIKTEIMRMKRAIEIASEHSFRVG